MMLNYKLFPVLFVGLLTITSCNNDAKQVKDSKIKADLQQEKGRQDALAGKIAFIEIDSVGSQYQYCIDEHKKMEQIQKKHEQTLASEERSLQQDVINFQNDVKNRKFVSQEDMEKRQLQLQKKEQNLMQHQQQLRDELVQMQMNFETGWRKRLTDYVKKYNADGKYDFILTNNTTTLNILYAKEKYDITKELIDGLNKEYSKNK